MKKILFLAIFIFASLAILSAQDEQELQEIQAKKIKIFNIGDGGIIKVKSLGGTLNIRIVYDKVADAPAPAQEFLGDYKVSGKPKRGPTRFSVKISDGTGFVLCKQMILFSNFSLDNTGSQPKAYLEFQTGGCGINGYEKIASVLVDYNSN